MNNGFSSNEEEVHVKPLEICCLVEDGIRCKNIAGNASYSKRIQKTVTQRKLKLTIDSLARHIYICDQHKAKIQCARTKRRRKDSDDDTETDTADVPEVDLYSLQVNTLRRYKKFYKVSTKPGLNKAQLAETIMKHFKTISIKEKKDIVTYFIYMVKTNSNKIDQKNGITNTIGDL